TILRAKLYSGLSGCTASQYLMKPSVIFLPSRMVSLESVIWTMRAITPSSRLRVIQSSWPSGPATNPSTVICTCSLSLRVAIKNVLVVGLTYASNQPSRNRQGAFAHESATWGLHLEGSAGMICNITVAYPSTASNLVAEESTHGSQHRNAQRHEEHRSDRKTGRAPRPTHARVARPHERGRVWHLVPRKTRWRVYRGQPGPGPAQHTGLRARDAGNAGRAHRSGTVLLVSLAPLRRRPRRGLLGRAHDAGRVHARGNGRRHRPHDRRVRIRSTPARPSRRGVPHERQRLDRADQAAREVCRVKAAPRRCSPRWATRLGSACWDACRHAVRCRLLVSVKGPG